MKLTYAWFANGVKIKKAKKKTYKVKAKDAGKQITVRVIGSCPGYNKAFAFSLATTIAS
ncbi:hypothetical protein GCM10010401_06670 [Rarobacter faecitabidus]|uniref:Uncharacterized protein n=1 Tax=Rarobacter faecitabidus TaxID=13243 RepID=A0A542ZTA4_RARFA|nr:hypothetical protein [Rarobacter faecitabidus]TQL63585.1 hypothetical protein FB461_0047 [Rarobacter faecitabidus]